MSKDEPQETITKADIKRKLDELVDETRKDISGHASKLAAVSAIGAILLSGISYLIGKSRGKRKARRD